MTSSNLGTRATPQSPDGARRGPLPPITLHSGLLHHQSHCGGRENKCIIVRLQTLRPPTLIFALPPLGSLRLAPTVNVQSEAPELVIPVGVRLVEVPDVARKPPHGVLEEVWPEAFVQTVTRVLVVSLRSEQLQPDLRRK